MLNYLRGNFMDANIKNVKFNIVDSLDPRYVEVIVTFLMDGVSRQHYIFITKRDNYKKKDYLDAAKEIFDSDVKNNKIKPNKKKTSPLLIGLTSFFAVTTLALGGVLIYKLLVKSTDNPVVPTGDIELVLDEESLKDVTLEPLTATKGKDYHGTLTVKEKDKGLILSHSIIKVGDKDLMYGEDFTIETKGNNNGQYEYALSIDSRAMNDNISLHMPSGDIEDFKIQNEEQFKSILAELKKVGTKAKLVSSVTFNGILPTYRCSTYDGKIVKMYGNHSNGDCTDAVFVIDSTGEKVEEYYLKNGTDMYLADVGAEPQVPTILYDMAYVCANNVVNSSSYTDYQFDANTLSYITGDSANRTIIKTYKGSIAECSLVGDDSDEQCHFFYEFNKINKPSASNSYRQDDLEQGVTVSDEVWNNLLTLDDSENLIFIKDGTYGTMLYGYNKDVIVTDNYITPSIYSHEGDKYFRYDSDLEFEPQWKKTEIDKKTYDDIGYDSFKNYLNDVRENKDKFTYNSDIKSYVSETYIPGEAFGVNFAKITSIDKSKSEFYINVIGTTPGKRYSKIVNRAAKITLPVVK